MTTSKRGGFTHWPNDTCLIGRTLIGVLVAVCVPCGAVAHGAILGMTPGHVYGVIEGGVREYDADLNPVADLIVPGVSVTEGVAFTADGHLVFSAYKQNPGSSGSTHHVLEVNAAGVVVRDRNLGIGYLDRAAHLDIDAQGRVYVASTPNLIELSFDFTAQRTMPFAFMRSSGVAVGPDNRIYVTDQVRNQLVIFDAARQFERSLSFGNVPTGLAVAPDGSLLAASFREDALRRTPLPADGTSTVVLSGINEPSDVAFAKDGSYYLSLGSTLQHRAADHSLLKSISTDEFTDSLVVFIPEPTSLATTCLVFLFLRRRSRSSAAT